MGLKKYCHVLSLCRPGSWFYTGGKALSLSFPADLRVNCQLDCSKFIAWQIYCSKSLNVFFLSLSQTYQ
jgi:hypothetical protein